MEVLHRDITITGLYIQENRGKQKITGETRIDRIQVNRIF